MPIFGVFYDIGHMLYKIPSPHLYRYSALFVSIYRVKMETTTIRKKQPYLFPGREARQQYVFVSTAPFLLICCFVLLLSELH